MGCGVESQVTEEIKAIDTDIATGNGRCNVGIMLYVHYQLSNHHRCHK